MEVTSDIFPQNDQNQIIKAKIFFCTRKKSPLWCHREPTPSARSWAGPNEAGGGRGGHKQRAKCAAFVGRERLSGITNQARPHRWAGTQRNDKSNSFKLMKMFSACCWRSRAAAGRLLPAATAAALGLPDFILALKLEFSRYEMWKETRPPR